MNENIDLEKLSNEELEQLIKKLTKKNQILELNNLKKKIKLIELGELS